MVKCSQINCVLFRFSSVPITKKHHDLLYTAVFWGILLPDVSFSTAVARCRFVPSTVSQTDLNISKYWFAGFGFDSGPNLQPRIHQIRKNSKEDSPIDKL